MNLLFVCSRNKWRSPTAEAVFKKHAAHQVRSGGKAAAARRKVREGDIAWADIIFVMETRHRDLLRQRFPEALARKKLVVLHIEDDYTCMDPTLIGLLQDAVAPYLLE